MGESLPGCWPECSPFPHCRGRSESAAPHSRVRFLFTGTSNIYPKCRALAETSGPPARGSAAHPSSLWAISFLFISLRIFPAVNHCWQHWHGGDGIQLPTAFWLRPAGAPLLLLTGDGLIPETGTITGISRGYFPGPGSFEAIGTIERHPFSSPPPMQASPVGRRSQCGSAELCLPITVHALIR